MGKDSSEQHFPHYPAVFVAASDAAEYCELLGEQFAGRVPVRGTGTLSKVCTEYAGEPVVLGSPDFLEDLLETRPPVEWVQSTWAGVTPLIRLDFRNYQLTSAKGVFGQQMSEYVFGWLLTHELKLQSRHKKQKLRHWDDSESGSLRGKVLGVMGTGTIGSSLAAMALNFAMIPVGFSRTGAPGEPFAQVYTRESLHDFLARCDYLVGVSLTRRLPTIC